jgi:hypothetical protein
MLGDAVITDMRMETVAAAAHQVFGLSRRMIA